MNKWGTLLLSRVLAGAMLLGGIGTAQHAEAADGKYKMSYLYFGKTSSYVQMVDNTQGALNVVSPNYFELNEDGTLKLTSKLLTNTAFIGEMHKRGIKVVPYVTNDWKRDLGELALSKRNDLAVQIAAAVQQYGLDGVNVDFEGLNEESRDSLTDFLRVLREKLPRDKQVSIAVAANPNDWKTGWHGSYDYAGLAQVSDFLMIMAYDENWAGDPTPGPVASMPFVEKSIQYALDHQVPSQKIVLGLPFYGRYWKTDGSSKGVGFSDKDVDKAIEAMHGTVTYDSVAQSPKATLHVTTDTKIGTHTFTPGTYEIWYENEQSLKAKLRLVEQYNLKGTGSWSLSQESADMWEYYGQWLNGTFFKDTAAHWAESYILNVSERGWMVGLGGATFAPDRDMTRAEAAVTLVRALGLDKTEPQAASGFTDVATTFWGKKEIDLAKEHGIINGTTPTTFAPNAPVTREQIAAMFTRLMAYQADEVEQSPFADVQPDDWAYGDILAMQQHGIINGMREGYFLPQGKTTRAQMATLMSRLAPEIDVKLGIVAATGNGTDTATETNTDTTTNATTNATTDKTTDADSTSVSQP
ncbi:MAG TPA: glycosyl hydrolase family 18 protein [Bacilli bacterium]|nr:glycosyl hydrolase family 18 protein [Bacilli bacterium]